MSIINNVVFNVKLATTACVYRVPGSYYTEVLIGNKQVDRWVQRVIELKNPCSSSTRLSNKQRDDAYQI